MKVQSSPFPGYRPTKLTQYGMLHYMLPMLFIIIFAVVGVGYLVYTHAATGTPEIKSLSASDTNTCIDVVGTGGNSIIANAKVDTATCNGSAPQKVSVSGSGSTMRLIYAASNGNHCLEPKKGAKASGTYVISNTTATCNTYASSKTEYWKAYGSGGYENVGASLCLTANGGTVGLTITKCSTTNTNQQWKTGTYTATTPTPPPPPSGSGSGGGTGSGGGQQAYCTTGGSQLWANLTTCGWPGPSNTGPDLTKCPGSKLTTNSGSLSRTIQVNTANEVISCENITGILDITAKNVTIENSSITSNSGKTGTAANGTSDIYVEDGASATISHVNINGDDGVHACIWDQGTSMTAEAVNCYGVDDGIFSWADTSYSQTTGDNFTIKDSYFHGLTTATANGHEDGYQTEGANNGVIQHNTYDLTAAADSDVAVWDSLKSSSNITVEDNLMTGGGFAIYAEDYNPGDGGPGDKTAVGGFSTTKIYFTNNDFSTAAGSCVGQYGVWYTRASWAPYDGGPTDGWHRSGNKVLETGENIDSSNPHVKGTLCS